MTTAVEKQGAIRMIELVTLLRARESTGNEDPAWQRFMAELMDESKMVDNMLALAVETSVLVGAFDEDGLRAVALHLAREDGSKET